MCFSDVYFGYRASVVPMVITAVSMAMPASPPPRHAEGCSLRSRHKQRIVPIHCEDMLSSTTVASSLVIILVPYRTATHCNRSREGHANH